MSISLYLQHDRNALLVAADCLQERGFEQQANFVRDCAGSYSITGCSYIYFQQAHILATAGLDSLYLTVGKPPVPANQLTEMLENGLTKLLQMSEQQKDNGDWRELCEQVSRLLSACRRYPSSLVEARS